ncbi:hypothetical protein NECAME_00936 [Necator americanus]|uniref:Uncharacterized protein n=1 Tax=Necator americanus TaxID=51031 RepID=W2SRD5_NECAM|nr:hypothetical protein NECAME_00936 [Necator americanus]ETN71247.1 hypothetical protein NECAME_00936 [Necator americanus]
MYFCIRGLPRSRHHPDRKAFAEIILEIFLQSHKRIEYCSDTHLQTNTENEKPLEKNMSTARH